MGDLTERYRKWSSTHIWARLKKYRESLKWWETKQVYSSSGAKNRADAIQAYSEHIKAMKVILASRTHGGLGKAA